MPTLTNKSSGCKHAHLNMLCGTCDGPTDEHGWRLAGEEPPEWSVAKTGSEGEKSRLKTLRPSRKESERQSTMHNKWIVLDEGVHGSKTNGQKRQRHEGADDVQPSSPEKKL